MKRELKGNELKNNKKGKELLEVYEWSWMIGELYDSICDMVNRKKKELNEYEWLLLKEYCKCCY